MLGEIEPFAFILGVHILNKRPSLHHQLLPHFLHLKTNREITHIINHKVHQLHWQLPELTLLSNDLHPPILLLRRHIRSTDDAQKRIDQKQHQDLAMAGPRRVREPERLHLVLQHVREREQAALARQQAAQVLDPRPVPFDAVEVLDTLVVVVAGALLVHVLGANFLAEDEVAVSDVNVVIVLDCGGKDVLV